MTVESSNNKSREEILARIEELNSLIKREEDVIRKRDSNTKTPEMSIYTTPKAKSLDEQLDEIESNARTSIARNANEMADKALEGNQEEIDNATLRINQFATIKDEIDSLKKKKQDFIDSGDSFDQALVDQIDKQIESLESLNPYSTKKEAVDTQDTNTQEEKFLTPLQVDTPTINESYASSEKTLNDTFNPREKSVAEAYEDGSLLQKENTEEQEVGNSENIKSPELIALEEARTLYASKQKEFLDNKRKTQNGINKIRDFFGLGKKVKEQDLPEELLSLKASYDQKKVVYGKSLIASYIEEIEGKVRNGEIPENQKDETLEIFMKGDLFDEIIVKERESLLALQAETLPAKEKGILNEALDRYLKLKPWLRTVISSALITGAIATTGAFTSTGAAGAYLGTKIARGVASVYAGKKLGNAADSFLEKATSKDLARLDDNARFNMIDFNDFENALNYAEKSYNRKIKIEQDTKRLRIITKGAISLMAGLGTSEVIGKGILPNISVLNETTEVHTPSPKISPDTPVVKSIPADSIKPIPDTLQTTPPPDAIKIGDNTSIDRPFETTDSIAIKSPTIESPEDTTLIQKEAVTTNEPLQPKIDSAQTAPKPEVQSTPIIKPLSVEADKLGAIETFKDLKEKLSASYPDPKLAPANVREILASDPASLAIKYGFYSPTQNAESAFMQEGEQLGFDSKGNLYFKDSNGTVDYLSENKGFDGKMIDTDNSTMSQKTESETLPKSIDPNKESISTQNQEPPKSVDPNIETMEQIPKSIDPNEVGFRQNMFYSKDPDLDAMTPNTERVLNTAQEQQTPPSINELLKSINEDTVHSLAQQQINKDIDSMFQKPNFILGGSTPGTKTEEWARTLSFMQEKKLTAAHLFEAQDAGMLQNSDKGEFFTLGEYARSLKYETGLEPKEGELLNDYLIRAQEYKIKNNITDKEMIKIIDEADRDKKIKISEETRQKIRARRSVDNDGVYN